MNSAHSPDSQGLSEIQFDASMMDDFPAMVWGVRLDGSACYYNKAARAFSGNLQEGAAGGAWLDQVHPEDRNYCFTAMRAAFDRREPFEIEFRMRRHDGEYRWLVDRGSPMRNSDGEITGYLGVAHDVTSHRTADLARRESEEQVRLLSAVTHDMIWNWDLRSRQVLCNAALVSTLGEFPSDTKSALAWWRERLHPDDAGRVWHAFLRAIEDGYASISYEYRIRDRTGAYLTVDDHVSLIRDHSRKLIRILGATRDVTKRKQAEEAQVRMTRILEATTDLVSMTTAEGQMLFMNAAGRKMLGMEARESLDFHFSHMHPEWANEIVLKEAVPSAIRDGYWKGETALLHSDGHEIPVSQVVLSHKRADGAVEFLSSIMRDLSDRKREEITRIEWANRYDAAIRASGQVLFDWNSFNNDITYAGDLDRLLGHSLSEMAGGLNRFRKLIHPLDLETFDQEVQRVIVTRDPFHLKFRVLHKNESYVFIEAKGYFFLDRRGQIGRMVGFFADVTSQHRAQEALARAHEGLEQRVEERTAELARTYLVIQDRALQQESVAHLGQRALGGAPLNSLLDEAAALVRTILHADCCAVFEPSADGSELIFTAQSGWPEGFRNARIPSGRKSQAGYSLLLGEPVISENLAIEKRFEVSEAIVSFGVTSAVSVIIDADAGPLGALCAFTLKKRAFVQDDVHFLQSVANVLSAAIQRRRADESIRLAREQAETASRAKSDLLSRMSHELRTPLNAILGFTQLLELDTTTPTLSESISHISRAGKHLLSLINEVLDITRIESGRLTFSPEPTFLPDFLRDVLDLIRPLAIRHGIDLRIDSSVAASAGHVLADPDRLRQVFFNLLSNAVKYNRPGGSVVVSCREEGPRIRINVIDTGKGIAPEKMQNLFLPFERLGAESTDIEGSGIGLALSRGIVTALDGELGVESVPSQGSTFWVTLPRIQPTPKPAPAVIAPAPKPPPPSTEALPSAAVAAVKTLLYIEDQDLNLRLVERIIQTRPQYRLLTAVQGTLGLELAREHRPDLVLLDLNLPDMTGDEILRRMKSDPSLKHIPVLMVSADAMGDRIKQLLHLGASGYLTKPYKVAELLRMIEEILTNH
jgi:PAS domain S-box-containing protein